MLGAALAIGCGSDDNSGGETAVANDSTSTSVGADESTGHNLDTTDSETGNGSTAVADSTGPSDDSTSEDGATTGEPRQGCGLPDLKPQARNPIASGGAGLFPADIADVLVASCGCHLADDHTVPMVPDYPSTGAFDMTTWDGFQALRAADDKPYYEVAWGYLDTAFMPLASFCNVGDGEAMDPAARALLLQWLDAGAPDGATWMP